MAKFKFFDRDISWLLFNGRVLQEARRKTLPLLERIKFLSIFSSNLDEFYRVRMPFLLAKNHVEKKDFSGSDLQEPASQLLPAQQLIAAQLESFGRTLKEELLPLLSQNQICLLYGSVLPESITAKVTDYLFTQVMAFLQPKDLDIEKFFPENNKLYFLLNMQRNKVRRTVMLNIPSDQLPRFFTVSVDAVLYIVFLDDVIRYNLNLIFKDYTITGCYSFKITRDAAIDFKDEYGGDYSDRIEKLILKRDAGLATRFLYQPGMPLHSLELIRSKLNLSSSSLVEGGIYHNLKDLAELPVHREELSISEWPAVKQFTVQQQSLFDQVLEEDLIIHPPYQSFGTVLRFFNEAAVDETVEEISVTLYRVASDSKIVNALISAAKNGKKVLVIVELKARFDEANNIKWAKKMKEAGIRIVYSAMALKVHAKIALIKKRKGNRIIYAGLLGTGNFNETTASFYTDHVLMTAHHGIMRELDLLFIFLSGGKKTNAPDLIKFEHLLVAGFNLLQQFLRLVDREIDAAKKALPAEITIKMNNLEEKVLISKLYEASQAGVKITLIIRGICCLIPGAEGISENITVRRIVDRYLEHGRVFIFHNQGKEEIYLGSADWMNRNIYRRIEVCFPIYDPQIRKEIREIIDLQLQDNVQAVLLDQELQNIPVKPSGVPIQSQQEIYLLLKNKAHEQV